MPQSAASLPRLTSNSSARWAGTAIGEWHLRMCGVKDLMRVVAVLGCLHAKLQVKQCVDGPGGGGNNCLCIKGSQTNVYAGQGGGVTGDPGDRKVPHEHVPNLGVFYLICTWDPGRSVGHSVFLKSPCIKPCFGSTLHSFTSAYSGSLPAPAVPQLGSVEQAETILQLRARVATLEEQLRTRAENAAS